MFSRSCFRFTSFDDRIQVRNGRCVAIIHGYVEDVPCGFIFLACSHTHGTLGTPWLGGRSKWNRTTGWSHGVGRRTKVDSVGRHSGNAETSDSSANAAAAETDSLDPMKSAGQTVRIVFVDRERDDLGLRDTQSELQAGCGLKIEITTMVLSALAESIAQNLRAPVSAFDIVQILGVTVASTVAAGLLENIAGYVSDPLCPPADYDFGDFPKGQRGAS